MQLKHLKLLKTISVKHLVLYKERVKEEVGK